MASDKAIGILALQGDFAAHGKRLDELEHRWQPIRYPSELEKISGLIIPGGESTTLLKALYNEEMIGPLIESGQSGLPILGTCAGAILLAQEVVNPLQQSLGLLDINIERNAYGRQIDSFIDMGECTFGDNGAIEMVFIRAPIIRRLGPNVRPLGTCRGKTVVAQEGRILATTFHPELSDDPTIHKYFLRLVEA